MEVPRPSSRVEIVAAMRTVRVCTLLLLLFYLFIIFYFFALGSQDPEG